MVEIIIAYVASVIITFGICTWRFCKDFGEYTLGNLLLFLALALVPVFNLAGMLGCLLGSASINDFWIPRIVLWKRK